MNEHPLEAGHRLRERAIREAADLVGAVGAQYYSVIRAADAVVRVHGIRGVGVSEEARARWETADGIVFAMTDVDTDHMAPVNELGELPDDYWQLPVARWAFSELGYTAILTTNVTAGREHRGLIGFVRGGDRRWPVAGPRLREATKLLTDGFRAAWDLDVALAPPAGSLTISADGGLHGPPEMVAWAEARAFAAWVAPVFPKSMARTPMGRTPMRGCAASFVSAVDDARGGTSYVFEPVQATMLPAILTDLSPKLRRVASLAAAGATNKEIAETLGKSADTVKEQLAEVYRRLGIASRAELAALSNRANT